MLLGVFVAFGCWKHAHQAHPQSESFGSKALHHCCCQPHPCGSNKCMGCCQVSKPDHTLHPVSPMAACPAVDELMSQHAGGFWNCPIPAGLV